MNISSIRKKLFYKQIYILFMLIFILLIGNDCFASDKVILQLRWDHQFQFAGYYAAEWMGYYEEAGIDIEIKSALDSEGNILRAITEVSDGRADFGVGAADILIARDKGDPLVITAVIFQQSASLFYALSGTKMNSPNDLIGLKVARNVNDLLDVELQAMLMAEGIDPDLVKPYPHQHGFQHLLNGKVDVVPGYSISVPYELTEADISFISLKPSAYGIDFYGDSLFTNESLVQENPDLIERFTSASLKGWEYALENSNEIALKISRELPRIAKLKDFEGFNLFQVDGVQQLIHYPIVEVGHINPYRWEKMNSYLLEIGLVENKIDLDQFIFNPQAIQAKKEQRIIDFSIFSIIVLTIITILSVLFVLILRKTVRDKTQSLNLSREHFEQVVMKLPVPVLITNENKVIEMCNDKFIDLFGYTIHDISTEEKWWISFFPDLNYRKKVQASFSKEAGESIRSKINIKMQEWDITIKDNSIRRIQFFMTPIGNKSVIAMIDITDRILAEENRIKLLDRLNNKGKMDAIGQLTGGIAHDFNNVLTAIISATQLLQSPDRDLDEKGKKYVNMILQSSERAADLTTQLMTFGRNDKSISSLLDIHVILDDTITLLRSTLDKRIIISISKKAQNSAIVGNDSALQSLLLNLGINASHAMPDGGELKIETRNVTFSKNDCDSSTFETSEGKFIEIIVKDNGCGIPLENREKIFEPFFTTKEQGKGTGLGLASVYGTVQNHKGIINVNSEVGEGSEFQVFLPTSDQNINKLVNNQNPLHGNGQVLFVDDEELIRVSGKHTLEEMGYEIILAKNGIDALQIFQKQSSEIDLVILDMIMPKMNGAEAFYKMKEIDKDCKVIISSGFTKDENIDELKKAGLAGYIKKPYMNHDLGNLISEVLKN